MGLVTFVDKSNGAEVTAEFPLHPGLVGFTRSDGSTAQLYREEFDKLYRQKTPDLPTVNPANVPPLNAWEAPIDLMPPGSPSSVPPRLLPPQGPISPHILGHEAWFAKIWDEIKLIRSKVDEVLDAHPIIKATIGRIEEAVAQTHPTIKALEDAVAALTEKKPQDSAPPPPPTGA